MLPCGQRGMVIREEHQSFTMTGYCPDEVEGLITMPRREHTAKIGVARWCFGEEHGSMSTMNQFRTEDRLQSTVSRHLEKADRAVEPIRIREGQRVLALCPYRQTEGLQRWDALHRGIGGVGMEVNEGGRH